MNNTAVVGINWGDEGKGRMVDLLTEDYDIVIRYQGGGNAGHTVINEYGKFALHLLPSGIFRKGTVNILGNGVALDPENLIREIDEVSLRGVSISPENLKISDRASLLMPWHRDLDEYEENRLAEHKYGSTKQGIAPFYSDKYQKKTVMAGELFHPEALREHLKGIIEYKNAIIGNVYHQREYSEEEVFNCIEEYGNSIWPFIIDTASYLRKAEREGKRILFEAQLGSLRDLDFGIYPYTTSSNTLAQYGPIGAGLPSLRIDKVIGIMKAYSTCVGEGPFVGEMSGEEAEKLREKGGEYGAKTGRARRVAPVDLVASRYGAMVQGADEIALTKLDILSYMERIPLITHYRIDGKMTDDFPFPSILMKAEPVIEYLDGFGCDISDIREYEKLPAASRNYVEYIEKRIGVPITYISVGAERDMIIRKQV